MDKFQDYYRIPSARADWWNYDSPGIYFITICSAYHECLFGSIANDEVILSELGIIVFQEWEKSFEMRSELLCDAFVIMPNHLHAVLRIVPFTVNEPIAGGKAMHGQFEGLPDQVETHGKFDDLPGNQVETHGQSGDIRDQSCKDARPCVSTIEPAFMTNKYGVAYRPPKSISSFIGGFKSAATIRIHQLRNQQGIHVWQARFHDRIIRDEIEYRKIIRYIELNPKKWKEDKYYK